MLKLRYRQGRLGHLDWRALGLAFCGFVRITAAVHADPTVQDFSARFPTDGRPGFVTVLLTDHLGNFIIPLVAEEISGLTPYSGRHGFDARTGGLFANHDVRNVVSSYDVGPEQIVVPYPINPVPAEVHNQSWRPQLVDGGNWLRLAVDHVTHQNNSVAWPQMFFSGFYDNALHEFEIRIGRPGFNANPDANDLADGIGWTYINSSLHGTSGAIFTGGEEPNLAGSLGIGFDIFNNGAQDNFAATSISLHWNGQRIKTVDLRNDVAFPFSLETNQPIKVLVAVTPGDVTAPILKGGTGYAVDNRRGFPAHLTQQFGTDAFFRLADELGDVSNLLAFDHTMDGSTVHATFDFRGLTTLASSRGAGMSLLLVPTDLYGFTGASQIPEFGTPVGTLGGVEEPNLAGAFGIGFDTFNTDGDAHDAPEGMGPVGNHVSLHWDGTKLAQTNFAFSEIDLVTADPTVWHTADVWITPHGSGSDIQVVIADGVDGSQHVAYNGFVDGMQLSSMRAVFAARTSGGAFDFYDIDNVNIRFTSARRSGDTDGDGRVDIDDLNAVRNHFGTMGPDDGTLPGDAFPFDGLVNIDDLNAVRNNFGAGASAVPEPSALLMAIAAIVFRGMSRHGILTVVYSSGMYLRRT